MLEQEVSTKTLMLFGFQPTVPILVIMRLLPNTEIDHDLHQYTSQGSLPGFDNILDLNQINPEKTNVKPLKKLFGKIKQNQLKIRRLLRQVHLVVSKTSV